MTEKLTVVFEIDGADPARLDPHEIAEALLDPPLPEGVEGSFTWAEWGDHVVDHSD